MTGVLSALAMTLNAHPEEDALVTCVADMVTWWWDGLSISLFI